jgi:hypothetical protein
MPYFSCTSCGKDTFMSAPDDIHTVANRNTEDSDNVEGHFKCECGATNNVYWHRR